MRCDWSWSTRQVFILIPSHWNTSLMHSWHHTTLTSLLRQPSTTTYYNRLERTVSEQTAQNLQLSQIRAWRESLEPSYPFPKHSVRSVTHRRASKVPRPLLQANELDFRMHTSVFIKQQKTNQHQLGDLTSCPINQRNSVSSVLRETKLSIDSPIRKQGCLTLANASMGTVNF